jgi:hypothetical protein
MLFRKRTYCHSVKIDFFNRDLNLIHFSNLLVFIMNREYEAKIDFDKVYKPLNHPSANQLERVMAYSRQFYDYIQKTSVTTIGESKFDDFELFEL